MKKKKNFWDKSAKFYTSLQEKNNNKLYNDLIEEYKPYINENKKVLELACGTGQLTIGLSNLAKEYIATDFSENMIIHAKERNILNANFMVMDATKLEFPDQTFDVVIIANALHILSEPKKAIEEIKRVLKDDGIIIAPTFVYEGKYNKFRLFLISKFGFKTYHKWHYNDYYNFIKGFNLEIINDKLIIGKPLPVASIIAKK